MDQSEAVASTVKAYILKEFLPGEDPNELTDDTPLMTSGILDSVATLKFVSFLEDQFKISLEAHEADAEYLDTIADIVKLVQGKKKK